jgi:hypothetical protein
MQNTSSALERPVAAAAAAAAAAVACHVTTGDLQNLHQRCRQCNTPAAPWDNLQQQQFCVGFRLPQCSHHCLAVMLIHLMLHQTDTTNSNLTYSQTLLQLPPRRCLQHTPASAEPLTHLYLPHECQTLVLYRLAYPNSPLQLAPRRLLQLKTAPAVPRLMPCASLTTL